MSNYIHTSSSSGQTFFLTLFIVSLLVSQTSKKTKKPWNCADSYIHKYIKVNC